jgi:hypothetical protein
MPEPVTTIGLSAVAAYLGKDGLNKLLGPTADYLGVSLKDFVQKRADNVGKIFGNAEKKLGNKINEKGQVPPKVLKTIIDEGSYCDDTVAVEYFGGVLASSRTESGRDDRGARIGKILDNMSVYQIRSHYLVYSIIRKLFKDSKYLFNQEDRHKMEIFIPWAIYLNAMQFNEKENEQFTSILNNTFFGLNKDSLIGTFYYGPVEHIQKNYADAKEGGIVVSPSALGAELYLWGYGFGDKELSFILGDANFEDLEDIPITIDRVLTSKKHI